jgi:hypothetical protein
VGGGCVPGTLRRTTDACADGEYRDTPRDAACREGTPSACRPYPPNIDIVLLVDVTGSHTLLVERAADDLAHGIAGTLLADSDVHVGVGYFGEYPVPPYGSPSDVPFGALAPLTDDFDAIEAALLALPRTGGGDGPEALIEALWVLAGGTPSIHSHPLFDCDAPLLAGACWRPDAQRVIVVVTDAAQHGMPYPGRDPLDLAYDADVGAPAWSAVRAVLRSTRTALFVITKDGPSGSFNPAFQLRAVCEELGQDPDLSVASYTSSAPTDLADESAAIATLIAAYVGL